MERSRPAGDGVVSGDPVLERLPDGERVGRAGRPPAERDARAAAVAAAASSTVPVWWFW
jgi:hypothetical protein